MSNASITIDATNAIKMFDELSLKDEQKSIKNGVRNSLNIIKKAALNEMQNVAKSIDTQDKWGNTLRKGVRLKVYPDGNGGSVGINHNTLSFFPRLLEIGTKQRSTRKGANRGRIAPTGFFTRAQQESEQQAADMMQMNIENAIQKINKKYM